MSQRTVMPYSATPPKPASRRSSSGVDSSSQRSTARGGHASPPIRSAGSGSTLRPSMPTTPKPALSRWCDSVKPAGPSPTTSTFLPMYGRATGRVRFSGFQRVSRP